MKYITRDNQGFTLMELLVAMTVFLLVIGLSSGIFIQTLRSQRTITSISESMNNVTLALEQMAREMRTGYDFEEISLLGGGIGFMNGFGEYAAYIYKADKTVGRCVNFDPAACGQEEDFESITSPNATIDALNFELRDENDVPLVTIAVDVSIDGKPEVEEASITLQTSVSSRIIFDSNV